MCFFLYASVITSQCLWHRWLIIKEICSHLCPNDKDLRPRRYKNFTLLRNGEESSTKSCPGGQNSNENLQVVIQRQGPNDACDNNLYSCKDYDAFAKSTMKGENFYTALEFGKLQQTSEQPKVEKQKLDNFHLLKGFDSLVFKLKVEAFFIQLRSPCRPVPVSAKEFHSQVGRGSLCPGQPRHGVWNHSRRICGPSNVPRKLPHNLQLQTELQESSGHDEPDVAWLYHQENLWHKPIAPRPCSKRMLRTSKLDATWNWSSISPCPPPT